MDIMDMSTLFPWGKKIKLLMQIKLLEEYCDKGIVDNYLCGENFSRGCRETERVKKCKIEKKIHEILWYESQTEAEI